MIANNTTFSDAGSCRNPLIRGFHQFLEVGVGNNGRWHTGSNTYEFSPDWFVHDTLPAAARLSVLSIFSTILADTMSFATRIAFLIAVCLEPPWAMTQTPLTPTK